MRLIAGALLLLLAFFAFASCAGTNTAVGITTNEAADAEQKHLH
jgi:hypothetical protein